MPICVAKKANGKQCSREASTKPNQDHTYCWQHQPGKTAVIQPKSPPKFNLVNGQVLPTAEVVDLTPWTGQGAKDTVPTFELIGHQLWVGDIGYAYKEDFTNKSVTNNWKEATQHGVMIDNAKSGKWFVYMTKTVPQGEEYADDEVIFIYAIAEGSQAPNQLSSWTKIDQEAITDGGAVGIFDYDVVTNLPPELLKTYAEDASNADIYPFGAYAGNSNGGAFPRVIYNDQKEVVGVSWATTGYFD
jgi:hypothetical protein